MKKLFIIGLFLSILFTAASAYSAYAATIEGDTIYVRNDEDWEEVIYVPANNKVVITTAVSPSLTKFPGGVRIELLGGRSTVSMTGGTLSNIYIYSTVSCNLTINRASFFAPDGFPGITLGNGSSLTIQGINTITSLKPSIFVPAGVSLIIQKSTSDNDASAILNVTTEVRKDLIAASAAIGSDSYTNCGTITINSGTINVKSTSGAGIGAGKDRNGGTVTINGGIVNIYEAGGGAAIGGGHRGSGGDFNMYGGTLNINELSKYIYGSAIGGGLAGAGGNVKILGGVINIFNIEKTMNQSGFGAGYGYDVASGTEPNGTLLINGGKVNIFDKNGVARVDANILGVRLPTGAVITDNKITAKVPYNVKNQTVILTLSDGATDYYYTDANFSRQVGNEFIDLKEGDNFLYIQVFSKDRSTKKQYTFTLFREYKGDTELLTITSPKTSYINGDQVYSQVGAKDYLVYFRATCSPGASYAIYSDEKGTKPISTPYINIRKQPTVVYIKVIGYKGATKIYKYTLDSAEYVKPPDEKSNDNSTDNDGIAVVIVPPSDDEDDYEDDYEDEEEFIDTSEEIVYSVNGEEEYISLSDITSSGNRYIVNMPYDAEYPGNNNVSFEIFYDELNAIKSVNRSLVIRLSTGFAFYDMPVRIADMFTDLKEFTDINEIPLETVSFRVTMSDMFSGDDVYPIIEELYPNASLVGNGASVILEVLSDDSPLEMSPTMTTAISKGFTVPSDIKVLPEGWGVWYYDELEGQVAYVPAKEVKHGSLTAVSLTTDTNGLYFILQNNIVFKDTAYHWASSYITTLAGRGIINGKTATTFAPNSTITRAEFITILAKAICLPEASDRTTDYSDVPAVSWYYDSVMRAKSANILKSISDGKTLNPLALITREEMSSIIAEVLKQRGFPQDTSQDSFSKFFDGLEISAERRNDVATVVKLGIMEGNEKSYFMPRSTATRAQSTVVIYRLLNILGYA